MDISVIVPIYNEEKIIKNSVKKLEDELSSLNQKWEIIFVNDGSTDNTQKILSQICKGSKSLKIVSYSQNKGRGKAIRTGFKHAKGNIIITIEADSSWGPNILERFSKIMKKNKEIDVLIASPHLRKGSYKNVPFLREYLSIIGNKILCFGSNNNLSMVTGMTRAYRKEVIKNLELYSDRKEIHLEIISKLQILGYNIKEIPATIKWPNKRRKISKKNNSFKMNKLILTHLLFTFNETPFLLMGTIGLSLTSLGIIFIGYIIYLWSQFRLNEGRPLIVFSVMLMLAGIQVLLFTFLANQNKDLRDQMIRMQKSNKN
jgi:dolichol-phosphate mannosyltransferase